MHVDSRFSFVQSIVDVMLTRPKSHELIWQLHSIGDSCWIYCDQISKFFFCKRINLYIDIFKANTLMFIIEKDHLIKHLQLIVILAPRDLFWLHLHCTLLLDPKELFSLLHGLSFLFVCFGEVILDFHKMIS